MRCCVSNMGVATIGSVTAYPVLGDKNLFLSFLIKNKKLELGGGDWADSSG